MHLHTTNHASRAILIAVGCGIVLGSAAVAISVGAQLGVSRPVPTQSTIANRPGRVLGQVDAAYGDAPMSLSGAIVSLKDPQNHGTGETARSDAEGHYEIPPHPPGTYRLCADAPGFVSTCAPEPAVIKAGTQYLNFNLALHPDGGALRGRVLLADGSPCYHLTAAFRTLTLATVTLTGPRAGSTAKGNNRGEFLLTGLSGPGAYSLTATCDGGQLTQRVTVTADHLAAKEFLDVKMPNSPPILRVLVPKDSTGNVLRAFSAGQTIQVDAEVVDPDRGDALTFKWTDGNPGFRSVNSRTISWTLPNAAAQNFLNVEVSDGKGGYAIDQLAVGTSDTGARFIGTLADPNGKPLANAIVSVDGTPSVVDAAGNFRVSVPVSERHVLTVKQPGHAPVSHIYRDAALGLKMTLKPATRTQINPLQQVRISEQDINLELSANVLVDPDGKRAQGPLNLDIYRYDPTQGELPGDAAALAADGSETTFVSRAAVAIEITDNDGKKYNIAQGSAAQLSFAPPASLVSSFSATPVTLASYEEGKGVWMLGNSPSLAAQGSFRGSINHLSIWSFGQLASDTACLQVKVDPFQLDRPFNLRVTIPHNGSSEVRDYTITQTVNLIERLPAFVSVRLDVGPVDGPSSIIQTEQGITGPNISPAIPPFPYSACTGGPDGLTGFIKLAAKLPVKDWLNRYESNDEEATAYYKSIGATPAKNTFAKWLSLNGFTSGSGEVVFFNPNELGLGRKVNCARRPFHQACYVTKYGTVGGSPFEAFDDTIHGFNPGDTVAMEADRPDTSKPPVGKFYIYGPDGKLRLTTHFDTSGPKYVNASCVHCHGGGEFVVLDPQSYQYPGVNDDSPFSLAQQQEKFRVLNETVAYAHVHTGKYWDFLNSLYPDGVHTKGAKAIPAPVPVAWQSKAFVFNKIIKPSCRTCHMWQSENFDFDSPKDVFIQYAASYVCSGMMPNAMSPMLRLWKTTSPNLVQALLDSQGSSGCGDVQGKGHAPTLTLVAPGSQVSYGQNNIEHKVTVTDAEDGPNCCKLTWTSDIDGFLSIEKNFLYSYLKPGPRTITVVATDKDGRIATQSMGVNAKNDPPSVTMDFPPLGPPPFKVVSQNTPVVLKGHGFDSNDLGFGVPCDKLSWTSTTAGDSSFPFNACEKVVSFSTLGLHVLTLKATDKDGTVNTVSQGLMVQAVPQGSPPVVTILAPHNNDIFDVGFIGSTIPLQGAVNSEAGAVTYRWTVISAVQGSPPKEADIGSGPSLDWNPSKEVPFPCVPIVVKLYATNANGTSSVSITLQLTSPICGAI